MTQPEYPFQKDTSTQVFEEAWQAQAFVIVCHLHEQGCFTWQEWAALLPEVIKQADIENPENTGGAYYHHWLTALEQMIIAKNLAAATDLDCWEEAWRKAYSTTPHGVLIVTEN